MNHMNFNSRRILVTGASSGLGRQMACQLALQHHADLILVARRQEYLQELKVELESSAGIHCQIIVADLSQPEDVERVFVDATAYGEVYGVILNAGITHFGKHFTLPWEGFQTMLATNVTSVVRLTNLFVPYLLERNSGGGIMYVSSMAGLLPVPYQAAYAGTKAFITNFIQSLQQELRDDPVSLTVFSPGGIDTAMTQNSKLKFFENTALLQDVVPCAHEALVAMASRKLLYVPGHLNRAQLFLTRFAPRGLVGLITQSTYKKALASA